MSVWNVSENCEIHVDALISDGNKKTFKNKDSLAQS